MKLNVQALSLQRPKYLFGAALMALAAVMPLFNASVSAEQITSRSIKMSNSAAGAASVSYEVSFKPGSSYNLKGIVIDFCKDSPIIGYATCDAPDGSFTVGGSPTISAVTGASSGTWVADDLNTGRTLTLSNSGTNNVTTASTITFTINNVTNPTPTGGEDEVNHTFFARIYTYSAAPSYTVADPGSYEDAGGVALSTANQVSVSGTVQETLTFCVKGGGVGNTAPADCTDTDLPTLELGQGTPKTLAADQVDTANAYSLLTTNAGGGAAIRMKSSNLCGGLSKDNGTNCEIGPVAAGSTTPAAIAAGTPAFGMRAASSGGNFGTLTTATPYANGTNYGMEWADNDTTGVTSTYGSLVASSTGVLDGVLTTYTFGATIGNTTPAGVYTANMTLIATGTY